MANGVGIWGGNSGFWERFWGILWIQQESLPKWITSVGHEQGMGMEARRGRLLCRLAMSTLGTACSGSWDFSATESTFPNHRFEISTIGNYTSLRITSDCKFSLVPTIPSVLSRFAGQFLPEIIGANYFLNTLFLFWYRVSGGLSARGHCGDSTTL